MQIKLINDQWVNIIISSSLKDNIGGAPPPNFFFKNATGRTRKRITLKNKYYCRLKIILFSPPPTLRVRPCMAPAQNQNFSVDRHRL